MAVMMTNAQTVSECHNVIMLNKYILLPAADHLLWDLEHLVPIEAAQLENWRIQCVRYVVEQHRVHLCQHLQHCIITYDASLTVWVFNIFLQVYVAAFNYNMIRQKSLTWNKKVSVVM